MSLFAALLLMQDEWPGFRGPTGQGIATAANLPVKWDRQGVLWSAPLVGEGHASPIAWRDRLFVCTVRWPGGKPDKAVIPEHHVVSYAAADGRVLWDTIVEPGPWRRDDFRSGPGGGYAAPTPVTDGRRVYVVFGSAVIAALDFEGKTAWRKEIRPFTFDVTVGSSPVLFGDTVILLCAMAKAEDSRLLAYAADDGAIRWEAKLAGVGFGHSTPLLAEVKGARQLLVLASGGGKSDHGLQAFDPAGGKRLWWCAAAGDASSPAFGAGIVYTDSGRGGPGIAVDPTGEGDVTRTHVRWTTDSLPESIGSAIVVGEHVFRLQGSGILKVWKASDGKETSKLRLEGIGSTWASPVADGAGRIYYANGGRSYVLQAGAEPKVLAVNELGDANHASPAVAGGRLFIAGLKNLYAIDAR